MNNLQLEQLRQSLRARGYSRSYVERLCDELTDHYLTAMEESVGRQGMSPAAGHEAAARRIGAPAEIVEAVCRRPELSPWADCSPALVYLVAPALVVMITGWLLIQAAYRISNGAMRIDRPEIWIGAVQGLALAIPAIAACGITWMAVRFRRPWTLPAAATAVLSVGGLYEIVLVACDASSSVFFDARWSVVPAKLAAPWPGLVIGLVAGRIAWRQQRAEPHRPRFFGQLPATSQDIRRGVLQFAAGASVLAVLFAAVIEHARTTTEVHPAEPIARAFSEPAHLTALKLELLARADVRDQLTLAESVRQHIDNALATYQKEWVRLSAQWMQADARGRVASSELMEASLLNTDRAICRSLSSGQKVQLKQMVWRRMDWQVLFTREVQTRLGLNSAQCTQLKDLLLEQMQIDSARNRALAEATDAERPEVEHYWNRKLDEVRNRMFDTLGAQQKSVLNRLMGGESN